MALDKDILGNALYNFRNGYNNISLEDLIAAHGSLEAARLAICKGEAEVIINHLKTFGEGIYQTGSLTAGATPVTRVGATVTVKIQ